MIVIFSLAVVFFEIVFISKLVIETRNLTKIINLKNGSERKAI